MRETIFMVLSCILCVCLLIAVIFPRAFYDWVNPSEGKVIFREPTAAQLNSFLQYRKLGNIEGDNGYIYRVYEVVFEGNRYLMTTCGSEMMQLLPPPKPLPLEK